jgi:hypothetical protein
LEAALADRSDQVRQESRGVSYYGFGSIEGEWPQKSQWRDR